MISKLRFGQTGDTIVEVLIAMAVLGVVLAGAFVTANSSLNGEHNAQEHTQALTIAQGQVEDLFANNQLSTNHCFDPTSASTSTGGQYCFESNTGQFCTNASDAIPIIANCPAVATAAYWYQINDTSQNSSLPTTPPTPVTTYEVVVSWPSIFGTTADVQLYYRPQ